MWLTQCHQTKQIRSWTHLHLRSQVRLKIRLSKNKKSKICPQKNSWGSYNLRVWESILVLYSWNSKKMMKSKKMKRSSIIPKVMMNYQAFALSIPKKNQLSQVVTHQYWKLRKLLWIGHSSTLIDLSSQKVATLSLKLKRKKRKSNLKMAQTYK